MEVLQETLKEQNNFVGLSSAKSASWVHALGRPHT